MAKSLSERYFFVGPGVDLYISVKGHSYAWKDAGDKWEGRNGKIEISCREFQLEISLPKEHLKKLIVKAQEFLKEPRETK